MIECLVHQLLHWRRSLQSSKYFSSWRPIKDKDVEVMGNIQAASSSSPLLFCSWRWSVRILVVRSTYPSPLKAYKARHGWNHVECSISSSSLRTFELSELIMCSPCLFLPTSGNTCSDIRKRPFRLVLSDILMWRWLLDQGTKKCL